MKASQAIAMLQKYYKPEDDLVIAWWDKEWVDNFVQGELLTDEQWTEVAEHLEDNMDNLGDTLSYDLQEAIEYLIPATNKKETA